MRLWTEKEHTAHPARELPKILRHDLAEVVLTLKASGITDMKSFWANSYPMLKKEFKGRYHKYEWK